MTRHNEHTRNGVGAIFILLLATAIILLLNGCHTSSAPKTTTADVRFKKIILTTDFLSEGVAVADVNKDGLMDVLAGTFWFEAPAWKRHEIDPGKIYKTIEYSNTFLDFAMDVNQDGWMDIIRIPTPGQAATWYENPRNVPGYWKERAVFHAVGNESPAFYDIDGDGLKDLVCADSKNKKMVWVSPPTSKEDTSWIEHIISNDSIRGTHMYTHGLGFGDMNNDGRTDVVMREGWWEAPLNRKQEDWIFHRTNISDDCSQMYVMDLDGDGDMDIISASAHRYGIWWHEQVQAGDSIKWVQHEIYNKFSQTHGMALVDINGDGYPDLVTGKRYYAHTGHDPGAEEPAMLYWFEYKPGKIPAWIPHQIDDNSGVGLQVVTQDMNKDNLPDIIVSNKRGVYIFEQVK
ncbi:MAG: FG-GAP and VCBS repeat-containing protein [Ginsengibacter sp.]